MTQPNIISPPPPLLLFLSITFWVCIFLTTAFKNDGFLWIGVGLAKYQTCIICLTLSWFCEMFVLLGAFFFFSFFLSVTVSISRSLGFSRNCYGLYEKKGKSREIPPGCSSDSEVLVGYFLLPAFQNLVCFIHNVKAFYLHSANKREKMSTPSSQK